ncbi:UDP-N-acetylmuramoyl-L-alanyl-D-glutamate--2,6-diaminopimelate ligase [soil metagenome]
MVRKLKNYYHLVQAKVANIVNSHPGDNLTIIGVTGTDGKTTTASLIYQILHENGTPVGLLTTVSALIAGKEYDTGFHVTTPNSFSLQAYLKKAKHAGATHFVLEVTSHALDQNRVHGIPFAIGVLTNITHEHLDYHKSYDNYVAAKAKLLEHANLSVINRDDQSYEPVTKILKTSKKHVINYGMHQNADVNPEVFPFKTNLFGKFNEYNCLAAITVAKQLGVADNVIRKVLQQATVPKGRQEVVYDGDFMVIVDFAHTPNSFERILKEFAAKKRRRLIHVFGCAGKRDETKRPVMGKASSTYADIIILTAEDPRNEPIDDIMADIQDGFSQSFIYRDYEEKSIEKDEMQTFYKIPDRQKAIDFAIKHATKGDMIVITGKGHENSMNYGHGEQPWSEFSAIEKALKLRESA